MAARTEPWHMAAAKEVGKIDKRLSASNYTTAIPTWLPEGARATFEGRNLARLTLPIGGKLHTFTVQGSRDHVEFSGSLATLEHLKPWVSMAHDILRRHAKK